MANKKGEIVAKAVVKNRKKDAFYFVDGDGDVRMTTRNTKGGKYGRTVRKKNKCTESAVDKRKRKRSFGTK